MTLATSTSKVSYAGNGTTVSFSVPFYFLDESHLQVILRNASGVEVIKTINTDYTVSNTPPTGGGVVMVVPPASGQTLVIMRNVPLTQEVDYLSNDPFPAETHEMALDKLTMEVQQLNEILGRAVLTQASDTITPTQLLQQIIAYNASSAASAASALASWQSFEGQYYGPYAADPTTDPLGGARNAGDLYFNTATLKLRIYSGSAWADTATASPVGYNSQLFNGTGAQTIFTLTSAPDSLIATEVFVSGVRQRSTTDYTVSGTTLTFVSAPATGTSNIFVRWTNSIAVGVPNNKSVTYPKIQDVPNQRILGRNTTGAGDVEEVTFSQFLDWVGSAVRGDILFRGATAWQRLAAGTSGQILKTLGAGADPAWQSNVINQGTVVSLSGTAVDFTGIPSWVRRITIMIAGMSTSGASDIVVRIGPTTVPEASGYLGCSEQTSGGSSVAGSNATDNGFCIAPSVANTTVFHGAVVLSLLSGSTWVSSSNLSRSDVAVSITGSGSKTITGTLGVVRITAVNGADTFDAGTLNISYEG